ncbi:PTS sugar transporter subunit IIA [Demequina muriae]|uniref:Mannitol-specific phosphotransferase enzyme IIA component n=1 Tax=Demequina muriae TaxID=3051664 RepID=A0ABT8GES1_9MICO|nr:PTS sugar transporter subunit IIA [Demequina sp. EGI L300058]MDN4479925.1 PTS sugar transporter subunit IIA [Demequina sp. EGI L300058]
MSPDRALLDAGAVRLGLTAQDKADALRQCGEVLVEIGAATTEYAAALHEREKSVSTYVGEGVAIPHGTNESREHIARAALAVLQFPDGVDWDGNDVTVCVAIASKSEEHVDILSSLARVLMDPEKAAALRGATTPEGVLDLLSPRNTEE